MAEYFWNAALMRRVFAVPEEVVDRHLRLAGTIQWKVLLWLSRNGGAFDLAACVKATGERESDCADALQYWVSAGVLEGDGVSTAPAPVAAQEATPVKKAPAARPKVTKPQMTEAIRRQKKDEEFGGLLIEVGARMGRPLSNGDAETLLSLS